MKKTRRQLKWLKKLVGARGFEPPTSCSQSRRATGLRYAPTCSSLSQLFEQRHHELQILIYRNVPIGV